MVPGLLLLTEGGWQVSHQSHMWFGSYAAHSTQSQHVSLQWEGPRRKTAHRQKGEKLNLQEVERLKRFCAYEARESCVNLEQTAGPRVCAARPSRANCPLVTLKLQKHLWDLFLKAPGADLWGEKMEE